MFSAPVSSSRPLTDCLSLPLTCRAQVRDVFRLAREKQPSIIFIDEVDSIATKRFDAQVSFNNTT